MKCLIEKKCGSCKYINTDYQRQLKIKTDYCKKLLKDNKLDMYEVKDTIGMGHPYEYRNKIIVAFNHRYEFGFMKRIVIRLFLMIVVFFMKNSVI